MPGDREDDAAQVVLVFPVLLRSHRVKPLLESLEAATPEPHRTIFVATAGDSDMIAAVELAAVELRTVTLEVLHRNTVGDYAKKVNYATTVSSEPFIFTGADDLHFHPGWLPAALSAMTDPHIGVVGTQDLAPTARSVAGEHATHFLVRRSYVDTFGTIDEPGKVFHEGYPHEFVDDELVETAKARGAWIYAADSVVEHLHPSWGKAERDALYNAQGRRLTQGRRVYRARRGLWAMT